MLRNDIYRPINQSTFKYIIKTLVDGKEDESKRGIINPKTFYDKYYNLVKQEKSQQLIRGNLIDDNLLGEEKDIKKYKVVNFKIPSSENQIRFCEYLLSLDTIDKNSLEEAYNSVYKTRKFEPIDIYNQFEEYLTEQKKEPDTVFINAWQNASKNKQEKALRDNPTASLLMFDENLPLLFKNSSNYESVNQLVLRSTYKNLPIIGTLDRVLIDHSNNKAILLDLKTTANIDKFHISYIKYGYYIQMAMYYDLLKQYLKDTYNKDYEISTFFVCVENRGEYRASVTKNYNDSKWIKLGREGGLVFISTDNNEDIDTTKNVKGYVEMLDNLSFNFETGLWDKTKDQVDGLIDFNTNCLPNEHKPN